jgi:hypothetical protein
MTAIPVPIPPVATGNKAHLLSTAYLNNLRGSLRRLASRPPPSGGPVIGNTVPPFSVSLRYDAADGLWYATASPGYVCQRDIVADLAQDAISYIEPANLWNGDYTAEFAIAENQALFVVVPELPSGAVDGDNVVLEIADDDTESTNYIPGPDAQEGKYYYKLAALKDVGGVLALVPFLAGSHIYHVSGLTADFVLLDCLQFEESEQQQIGRLSFLSGRLRAMNETEEERDYAPAKAEVTVNATCT